MPLTFHLVISMRSFCLRPNYQTTGALSTHRTQSPVPAGAYPSPVQMHESEFHAVLSEPVNANFAKALRQAEAPAGRTPPGGD